MANRYQVQVEVASPARGSGTQTALKFAASQFVGTWSWGLQPGTALIEWVSADVQAPIVPLAMMTIRVWDCADPNNLSLCHTFYGVSKSAVPVTGSDGRSTLQEFVDSRLFLQYDDVFCAFNVRESVISNGQWLRRYWHILPNDFATQRKTYTNGPLTARQILDHLFAAPTVKSPWSRTYVDALDFPVYNINCLGGQKLGAVISDISARLGCVFTLMGGRYWLVWTMKGVGTLPAIPANADKIRQGKTITDNPTRVRILGDRNLYQVLGIDMVPDWLTAWQQFYDLDRLVDDLFDHEKTEVAVAGVAAGTAYKGIPGDTTGLRGRFLASARARTITVGQYAYLRDQRDSSGAAFRDFRRFGGRSRLQMPAALYISTVLFRAYRPPDNFRILNAYGVFLDLYALEMAGQGLVEVTHDPQTGAMGFDSVDVISASNGYAIVQGYQVGQDAYKTLRPEFFSIADWVGSQDVWQRATFQIDDSGYGTKFIIFDQPVLRTGDMIKASVIDGTTQKYAVLNSTPTIVAAPVKASLVFAGEPMNVLIGDQSVFAKDDVVNSNGLGGEFVAYPNGRVAGELQFADGETATEKAIAIGESLLNRQFVVDNGGYEVQGINGTQLSSMVDRVTVKWNPDGATEDVDFTNERDRNVSYGRDQLGRAQLFLTVPSERDFDRRSQLLNLLPGQKELREEARQFKLLASALQQNPKLAKTVAEAFAMMFGLDAMPHAVFVDPLMLGEGPEPIKAGTPIFKESGDQVALSPLGADGDVTATDPVFLGVTVFDGEQAAGSVRVTATGNNGVVYARVKGPAAVNDTVGMGNSVVDTLEKNPTLAVGNVLEAVADSTTALVPVRTNGAGGGGGDVLPVWL